MFGQGFNYGFLGKPLCFTDTTDIFKDNSGVALYTLDYDASASDRGGKFGEAAKFNNTNSYVELPSTIDNPMRSGSAFTVSLWYKHAAQTNSYGGAIMKLLNDIYNLIDVETNGTIRARVLSSSSVTSEVTSSALTVGNWYHIVWTGNTASGVSLYINNSLIGNTTWDGTFYTYTNSNYAYNRLGYQNLSVASLVGEIDQVRFFNRLVTSAEVSTLYNESKETTNTLQILGDSSCYATYTLNNNVNDLSGNYNATSSNLVYTNINGTPSNVDFGVGGKSLYGARFNGSNSAIIVPNNILASNNHSISTWFYLNDTSGIQTLIEFDYGNRIIFRVASTDSNWAYIGGSGYFNHGISFSAGQWYHLAITFSAGSPFKIYVNGNLSYTGGNTNLYLRTVDNIIGAANSSGANGVDGTIDQVRLFNKALSAAEISKLYGNGTGEIACEYTATTTDVAYPIANTAYYKLDNNSKDLARSTGKFNESAIFNGSSSKIDLPAILPTNSTADSSVSFWFKYDGGQSGTGTLFSSFGGNTSQPGYHLGLEAAYTYGGISYPDGSLYLTGYSMGTGSGVNGTTSYADGQWHHVVVTYDFSTGVLSCFVDNASSATLSISFTSRPSTIGPFSQSGNIGYQAYGGPHRYAKCSIDQFRIFNKDLTSTERTTLYNETTTTANTLQVLGDTSCVATYQLDGNSTDLSGNYSGTDADVKYAYDGTESNIEYRFGRFGQAAVFNGTNSVITLGTNIFKYTNLTVSAWINPNVSNTNVKTIYGNTSYINGQQFHGIIIGVQNNSSADRIIVQHYPSSTNTYSVESIPLNTYTHVAVTSTSSETKIYINGRLDSTHSASLSYSGSQTATAAIGAYLLHDYTGSGTWDEFSGKIDQVRIFESVLSAANITSLIAEKPEVDTSNFKTVLYEGNGATRYISSVGFEPSLTWFKARTVANYDHGLFDVLRGDGENYISSNLTSEERIPSSISNYGYVSSYDANGVFLGQGGNSNHPWAVTNKSNVDYVAWNWKSGGLLNRSASFNGSSSKIDLGNNTSNNTPTISVSLWFKTSGHSGAATLINNGGANSGETGYFLGLNSNGTIKFEASTGIINGSTNYADNNWHQIVLTLNNGAYNIYVDGNQTPVLTGSGAFTSTATRPTWIGQFSYTPSAIEFWNGLIDQVRVFNKAISASEVTTLYNETASTINTLQVLGDTSCVAAYPLGVGAGDLSNTYSGTPSNVTFNNPGHLTRNNSGTIESTVSANTDAGFSIVNWSGSISSDAQTVGHGLSSPPELVILKNRDVSDNWYVFVNGVTSTSQNLKLNTDDGVASTSTMWGAGMTSTVAGIRPGSFVSSTSNKVIMYCWHSVAGYSSIGTYTGNGSTTGTIVTLDFAPSFVMIKGTDQTSDWIMIDNKRDTTNPNSARIDANSPGAEYTGENIMDLNSNGFQLKTSSASKNGLNKVFIYMAFK